MELDRKISKMIKEFFNGDVEEEFVDFFSDELLDYVCETYEFEEDEQIDNAAEMISKFVRGQFMSMSEQLEDSMIEMFNFDVIDYLER